MGAECGALDHYANPPLWINFIFHKNHFSARGGSLRKSIAILAHSLSAFGGTLARFQHLVILDFYLKKEKPRLSSGA